jgi:hypothetical protein
VVGITTVASPVGFAPEASIWGKIREHQPSAVAERHWQFEKLDLDTLRATMER